jgi:NAD(P)-dependent dehydrogenase (short-subunit alcohol dehydrogenase family)
MEIKDKVAIVTGGASGIGRGLAHRFAAGGARAVIVADLNFARAQSVAQEIGAVAEAFACDVSLEADIQALVAHARGRHGQVDAYLSNAGILGPLGGLEVEDALWDKMWQVHGMAHVWAARAVVPEMAARCEGFFLVTASAAGLLNIVENAPYAVTKHAAVAFAEWLRIAYGRRGVRVACLCPQLVQTDMVKNVDGGSAGQDGILSPEQVAEEVVRVMREEKFLVLPHPEVLDYFRRKGENYDRWLGGMQKLYATHGQAGLGKAA